MSLKVASTQQDPINQFSVFTENKVGRLLEIVNRLNESNVHLLAVSTIDLTESSIVRFITDDPQATRQILNADGLQHAETQILVVEMKAASNLQKVLLALLQAEINVHYTYSLLVRPGGKPALALCLEDIEVAENALSASQFRILSQRDLSR